MEGSGSTHVMAFRTSAPQRHVIDHDEAAEALLALQGMVHTKPASAAMASAKQAPRAGSGSSSPCAMNVHREGQDEAALPGSMQGAAEGSGDAGSSGNACTDEHYNDQEGGCGAGSGALADPLHDMQVTVDSETDKGCQCWFPPLPYEELRQRGLVHHVMQQAPQPARPPQAQRTTSSGDGEGARKRKMDDGGSSGYHTAARPTPNASQREDATAVNFASAGDTGGQNKRPRFIWTNELHERFVQVVNQLGPKTAVPKSILQMLNVDGMTRENVASHLQKYRLALRRGETLRHTGSVASLQGAATEEETPSPSAPAVAAPKSETAAPVHAPAWQQRSSVHHTKQEPQQASVEPPHQPQQHQQSRSRLAASYTADAHAAAEAPAVASYGGAGSARMAPPRACSPTILACSASTASPASAERPAQGAPPPPQTMQPVQLPAGSMMSPSGQVQQQLSAVQPQAGGTPRLCNSRLLQLLQSSQVSGGGAPSGMVVSLPVSALQGLQSLLASGNNIVVLPSSTMPQGVALAHDS